MYSDYKEYMANRKLREEVEKILADPDPSLDIPYPYMEYRTRPLYTGRVYTTDEGFNEFLAKESVTSAVDEGHVTGSKTTLYTCKTIVTPREMKLRELLGIKLDRSISNGNEEFVNKDGEGETDRTSRRAWYRERMETRPLTFEEIMEREDTFDDAIKEAIRKRKEEIASIGNNKEMRKRGIFFNEYHGRHCVAARASAGDVLRAFGQYGERHFYNSTREMMENKFYWMEEFGLAITMDNIKYALQRLRGGER